MHAYVSPAIWNQIGAVINTGGVYYITNFRVSAAIGVFRPVRCDNCIHFIPSTMVHLDPHDDFIIPMHKFELIPLSDLYNHCLLYPIDHQPLNSNGKIWPFYIKQNRSILDFIIYLSMQM